MTNSAPGIPDREDGRTEASRRWRLSNGQDVDDALNAAERLLRQADERHRHEQNRAFALSSIIVALGLSLIASLYGVIQNIQYHDVPNVAAILTSSFSIGGIAFIYYTYVRQRTRVRSDNTLDLAAELAALVGEAFLEVSESERWSYLKIQTFKMRLSAFPLYRGGREGSRNTGFWR